jgi:hypothetical protein
MKLLRLIRRIFRRKQKPVCPVHHRQEHALSDMEKTVLEYVSAHQGLVAEQIAENWQHSLGVYNAIYHLVLCRYVHLHPVTRAITPAIEVKP